MEFWIQTIQRTYYFDDPYVTVGTDPRCYVCLSDDAVKPLHVAIHAFAGRLWLEPKNPYAVTFVNYRPVHQATELFNGDQIDIGPYTLIMQAPSVGRRPRTTHVTQPRTPNPFWTATARQTMEIDPVLVPEDTSGTIVVL